MSVAFLTPPDADDGEPPRPRVSIEGDGDLARNTEDLEHALLVAHAPIYQRANELVRVIDGEAPRRGLQRDPAAPLIVRFTDVSLQVEATRHVEFVKRDRRSREARRVDCPLSLARALRERRAWAFPQLAGVVEHPIVLPDGRVLSTNGYDEATGLLFRAAPDTYNTVDANPTRADAMAALARLRKLLAGFPFVDEDDEAVAVALLITPFVRPILATAPAICVNAPAPGTGKSFLVRLASILASGREPALMTVAEDPAELKKVLFAALLQGDEHIALDNVVGVLDSPALCALLTSPRYQDRVLGASETVGLPTATLLTINGNNVTLAGDLTRRVLECRLDARCERPAERRFDFDPIEEVRALRPDFVADAVTVLQAYAQHGELVEVAPFGSFEDWSRMVREPLMWLGMADPCASLRHLEDEDPERAALRAMLSAVGAVMGDREWRVGDLLAAIESRRQADLDSVRVVPPEAQEALREALRTVAERNGELSAKAAGRWLRRVAGRVLGRARFVKVRDSDIGIVWRRQDLP